MQTSVQVGKLATRTDLHLPRKLWHLGMGTFIVAVYLGFDLSRATACSILGFFFAGFLVLELVRLRVSSVNSVCMRMMGLVMRREEAGRLSGVPYYLAASILAIAVFPKMVSILCLLYLAVGDPTASLVGILWGHRGPRLSSGKSLVGSIGCGVVCMMITAAALWDGGMGFSPLVAPLGVGAISILGGFAGAFAEAAPVDIDDNFAIPLISGVLMTAVFLIFGLV